MQNRLPSNQNGLCLDHIHTLKRNRAVFLEYNGFRKRLFAELAPETHVDILHLLPWLICINHPNCPGYVPEKRYPFRIYDILLDSEIKQHEYLFKARFGIKNSGSLLNFDKDTTFIEGVYTIGSVGSVSQTSSSDCDIWICCDKRKFDSTTWRLLNKKINLIKDWFDSNVKIPVYFFISDVQDIREGRFGSVDVESSGSSQKNVLKEEFYRTCIVISGKIPLWWVCYREEDAPEYKNIAKKLVRTAGLKECFVDFGDIREIETGEYFGAALWQLHKSLSSPMKSIIKMILLDIMLSTPDDMIICAQFRRAVLSGNLKIELADPSIFSMAVILSFYSRQKSFKDLKFLTECFYLRCRINPADPLTIKKKLSNVVFSKYPIELSTKIALANFKTWDFKTQVKFGNRIFRMLIDIFKNNPAVRAGKSGKIAQNDLLILKRRISAYYQKKNGKVPIIHKPESNLNLNHLIFSLHDDTWQLKLNPSDTQPLLASDNVIELIAFISWNGLFDANLVKMEPNSSSITIQEIINLGISIRSNFGAYENIDTDISQYLEDERKMKILVVISFETSPWEKKVNDFSVVYMNSWGELFVEKFSSKFQFTSFIRNADIQKNNIEVHYYLQKNSTYFEKIISRTKNIIYQNRNDLTMLFG